MYIIVIIIIDNLEVIVIVIILLFCVIDPKPGIHLQTTLYLLVYKLVDEFIYKLVK